MLRALLGSAAFLALSVSVSWAGQCPSIGPAPRLPVSAKGYETLPNHSLDKDGVLAFDYGAAYNNLGKHNDPYFVSIYALTLYRDWLNSSCTDEQLKRKFLIQVEWLNKSAEWRGDLAVWAHPFENSYYHLKPGWISGIGQSRIASALYRAGAVTGDGKFARTADGAMLTYLRPTTDGGVVNIDGDVTWIEEAPDPNGRSYKVLNGHITALSGIYDVFQITKDPRWKEVFDRGVAAVKRDIPKFDAGFASAYSLDSPSSARPIANLKDYNILHVSQLLWLYEVDRDPMFLYWASRFQAYELNTDTLSASNSINAKDFGPDKAAGLYYNHYWSTGTYPTTFTLSMKRPEALSRVAIDGHILPTSPSYFDVELLLGNNIVWKHSVEGIRKQNIDIDVPVTGKVDSVRLILKRTVADEVMALTAVAAVRAERPFAPISRDCNYRPDSSKSPIRYNVDRAFDRDTQSVMEIYCPGFIVFPTNGANQFQIDGKIADGATIKIKTSTDLLNWSNPVEVPANAPWNIPTDATFVEIEHSDSISIIREIKFRYPSDWPWPLEFLNPEH